MYNYNLTQNDIASSFITELAIRAFKVDTVALLESLEVGRQFASIGKSYVLVGPIYFEKHVQNILPTLCCTFWLHSLIGVYFLDTSSPYELS